MQAEQQKLALFFPQESHSLFWKTQSLHMRRTEQESLLKHKKETLERLDDRGETARKVVKAVIRSFQHGQFSGFGRLNFGAHTHFTNGRMARSQKIMLKLRLSLIHI